MSSATACRTRSIPVPAAANSVRRQSHHRHTVGNGADTVVCSLQGLSAVDLVPAVCDGVDRRPQPWTGRVPSRCSVARECIPRAGSRSTKLHAANSRSAPETPCRAAGCSRAFGVSPTACAAGGRAGARAPALQRDYAWTAVRGADDGTLRWTANGNVNVKVEPLPGSLSAQIAPPCAWTICFAIARPRPVPSERRARSDL